ncbi:Hypothetical predicted protein [Cloeon dipterum]|uniref:Uncharacterized protein n=1 Tax=Cloeon dipterum TaxID=197152 RepID=A0A8S1DDP2_9INSE|nr:Hypothetical predicted protein [Cloeon dipterum]
MTGIWSESCARIEETSGEGGDNRRQSRDDKVERRARHRTTKRSFHQQEVGDRSDKLFAECDLCFEKVKSNTPKSHHLKDACLNRLVQDLKKFNVSFR